MDAGCRAATYVVGTRGRPTAASVKGRDEQGGAARLVEGRPATERQTSGENKERRDRWRGEVRERADRGS